MHVVTLDPKEKEIERRKVDLLEVIDEMRRQVEEGSIREFVATSMSYDGDLQIHVVSMDLPGGIGLYEIGKVMLINKDT